MSKIICEICGTAYSDAEHECPVCGFKKPETAEFAPEDTGAAASAAVSRSRVRGGRFSAGNVNKAASAANKTPRKAANSKSKKKKGRSDRPLIIAVIILLITIAITTGYIYFKYFAYGQDPSQTTDPAATTTEPAAQTDGQTTAAQTQGTTAPEDLSCTGLTLYEETVSLNKAGSQWLLNVVPTPANTTDVLTYTSADESVATVSADGKITAVGNGETVITISCGSASITCKVLCTLAPEETQPQQTDPVQTQPQETKPQDTGDFKLRKDDITFDAKGQTYTLYNGAIDVKDIKWTVGNSAVAIIQDGVVKAVGPGITNVYAEYNGVKLHCVIRCDF